MALVGINQSHMQAEVGAQLRSSNKSTLIPNHLATNKVTIIPGCDRAVNQELQLVCLVIGRIAANLLQGFE